MSLKGVIILQDKGSDAKKTKVVIDGIASLQALGTFATAFDSFSNAKIVQYDVIEATQFAGELGTGTYDSIEQKASAIFRYFEDGKKKFMRLEIPAPDDDVIEFVNGKGYRVSKGIGDGLAAMLNTLTGRSDIEFMRGKFFARPTKGQGQ
jgi:hypothetical protein